MKVWLKNRISRIGCLGGIKALSCLAACLCIAMSCPVSAQAGWVETPEWRYVEEDGTLRKGAWYENGLGEAYYLDENGCMVTGFYDTGDGDIRFFDPSGVLTKGLIEVDGAIYFLDDQGKPVLGDVAVNGEFCTFGENGLTEGEVSVPLDQRFYYDRTGVLLGGVLGHPDGKIGIYRHFSH
jgi:glucan-binding YG repeat protein